MADEEKTQGRPTASMTMIGALWATIIRRAVSNGRAYVDENGVAHLVDGIALPMIEWAQESPLVLRKSESEAVHAAS